MRIDATTIQSRAPEPRYLVSERPIDVGLGPWGLCVALDPLDRQRVWWWEPGASGCRSRSKSAKEQGLRTSRPIVQKGGERTSAPDASTASRPTIKNGCHDAQ
jgi:hypothetical protein